MLRLPSQCSSGTEGEASYLKNSKRRETLRGTSVVTRFVLLKPRASHHGRWTVGLQYGLCNALRAAVACIPFSCGSSVVVVTSVYSVHLTTGSNPVFGRCLHGMLILLVRPQVQIPPNYN